MPDTKFPHVAERHCSAAGMVGSTQYRICHCELPESPQPSSEIEGKSRLFEIQMISLTGSTLGREGKQSPALEDGTSVSAGLLDTSISA